MYSGMPSVFKRFINTYEEVFYLVFLGFQKNNQKNRPLSIFVFLTEKRLTIVLTIKRL